jgi:hypothetical protein
MLTVAERTEGISVICTAARPTSSSSVMNCPPISATTLNELSLKFNESGFARFGARNGGFSERNFRVTAVPMQAGTTQSPRAYSGVRGWL